MGDASASPESAAGATPARAKPCQAWRTQHLNYRRRVTNYEMSDEERAARRAAYAERDRATSRARADRRRIEQQAAKAADAARLAAEVARIRAEVRLGLLPPPGRLAAVDTAAMLLIGPLGAVGCPAALLRSLAVLMAPGRHPVPSLLAAGPWQDEAALRAALEAFRPRMSAIGLRVCRRREGWRLTKASG